MGGVIEQSDSCSMEPLINLGPAINIITLMFKKMESDNKISRDDYAKRLPELRRELLEAQFSLQEAGIPLLIIIAGVEGAEKGEVDYKRYKLTDEDWRKREKR